MTGLGENIILDLKDLNSTPGEEKEARERVRNHKRKRRNEGTADVNTDSRRYILTVIHGEQTLSGQTTELGYLLTARKKQK